MLGEVAEKLEIEVPGSSGINEIEIPEKFIEMETPMKIIKKQKKKFKNTEAGSK